jgi:Holliday junction resolvasome RuvABC endonuclease subunit
MRILAIDPGNTHSGYALIDHNTRQPIDVGKIPNNQLLDRLCDCTDNLGDADHVAIEMIASYGMSVGKEVFETCVWIGRFRQAVDSFAAFGVQCELVYRLDVKLHHCGSSKAKDSNITQALIDRFAHNQPNRGKGTKSAPGWFFGFKQDIWQAYALAVLTADTVAVDVHQGVHARGQAS